MIRRSVLLLILVSTAHARADVFSYECTSFPEVIGWERDTYCSPVRWQEAGWLFQHVEAGECDPPPGGDRDSYSRSLENFAGEQAFFVEWRMETDGDNSEITGVAPASVSASGFSGVLYHATIARDLVRLYRDYDLPILWVQITEGVPHTYRVEIYGADLYIWFIDGLVIDSGVPEGAYPTWDSSISWRARSWYLESTTKWDYIRYGTIPEVGSGDYDSDGDVDEFDLYFFHECLLGPDVRNGPGCRFADFDADTDCDDWQAFKAAFIAGGGAPPPLIEPAAFTDVLLNLNSDPFDHCAADMNADGTVNGADIQLFVDALLDA